MHEVIVNIKWLVMAEAKGENGSRTRDEYVVPERQVLKVHDMNKWLKSKAYHEYIGFIQAMSEGVKGKKLTDSCKVSETTENVNKLIQILNDWVDDIPPIEQPQRFGNKAFRTFYEKLSSNAQSLLKDALPEQFQDAVPELAPYFVESFGNSTRIDYGTGHEMSFCMFLCCLFQLKAFTLEDSVYVINNIFYSYLKFMQKLQTIYRMEPAGSHGVWSLDDYQFMPFIWGSAQLISHPKISPNCFTEDKIVNAFADDYMFLTCIKYIKSVKFGPFAEHSNQLWNISGVSLWSKINSGLMKMYKAEVLGKFPVIQHTLFGSILSISPQEM